MFGLRPIEVFLIQFIIYMALWLWDTYIAVLVSSILGSICLLILIISLLLEWIEPSKVPKWYFWLMGISIATPLLTGLVYILLLGGEIDWLYH